MTSGVFAFCIVNSLVAFIAFIMLWRSKRKVQAIKNTRHVISLPLGTRFTMDDSESIWVLVHLNGCGLSVEWRGNDCSAHIQKERYIVGDEKHLRHTIVKVVK